MKTKSIFLLIIILLTTNLLCAQTIIREGKVSGSWEKALSPYYILGDIIVPENAMLVVEAGVKVIFDNNVSLQVMGQLTAIGNETDSIVFTANKMDVGWAGIRWYGSALIEYNPPSRLEYCKFTFAKSRGRFPSNYGGAIGIINTSNVIISHCLFSKCEALEYGETEAKGGAMVLLNSNAKVSHCTFQGNTSELGGALLLVAGSKPLIDNCLFTKNRAMQYGGAVEVMEQSAPIFVNCTFADNYAERGGGAFDLFPSTSLYLLNSIVWNNQSGRVLDQVNSRNQNAGIRIVYCNIQGGVESILPHPVTNESIGNIDVQPGFFGPGAHPYSLATDSPCIDAGTTEDIYLPDSWNMFSGDLAGNFRIANESIDLGCYEYVVQGPLPPTEEKQEIITENPIEMLVYPSPARTQVHFQYATDYSTKVRILLFDVQGRLLRELVNEFQHEGVQKITWNVQTLPKGTYIYKLTTGNQQTSGRILVVN